MKVSEEAMTIVVPVYNRPQLVVRSLDSLKAQTWRPLHIIIVDNGSTDNTPDVLTAWKGEHAAPDFSIDIYYECRKGAAYAREKGLEHTKTDKVMFFDSDDVLRPDSVASIMKTWRGEPDAKVIAFPMFRHQSGKARKTHSVKGKLIERHLVHAILQTEGFAIKTDFLRSVGGWRGEYPVWNDFETGTRILLSSPKVAAIKQPLSDVYAQKISITGTSFSEKHGLWEKSLDGIEKAIRESGRKDTPRLLDIVNYRRAILAADYYKEGHKDLATDLMRQVLDNTPRSKRPVIRFAYLWTRNRMRGAFSIIGKFL